MEDREGGIRDRISRPSIGLRSEVGKEVRANQKLNFDGFSDFEFLLVLSKFRV